MRSTKQARRRAARAKLTVRPSLERLEERSVPSLAAAYALDEGSGAAFADASGNGNAGTTTNASWSSAGKYGAALQFSGATTSMATVSDSPSVDLTTGLTLEAWVKASSLSSPSGGWDAVVAKDNKASSANDISYALYAANGTGTPPALHLLIGGKDVGLQGTSVLTLNTWVFLAATYDGANMRLYVNGTQVASKAKTGSITTTKDPLHLGGDWDGEMFTGLVDNVRVYNTALTAAQVQADMSAPVNPDTTPPTVSVTAPSDGATVSGTVTLSASASDNVGVASVQFLLNGANLGSPITAAPYTFSWNTGSVGNGTYTLAARAVDTSGNAATSSSVTVTVSNSGDTTPPTVSLTSPANNASVSGTVTVSASASDNVGVASVQFELDGAKLGPALTTAPYTYSWDTTTAGNGTHTLTAVAADAAGNTASSSVTVSVANTNAAQVGQWSSVINMPDNPVTGDPVVPINMVLLDNGKLLFWDGGPNCLGAVSPTVWDPVTNTFTALPLENQTEVRDIFCSGQTVLANGDVLVVGGHDCTSPTYIGTAIANLFDPSTNTWTFLPNMNDRRWYPDAITLPNGDALVTAGSALNTLDYDPIPEVYDPTANTWTKLTGADQVIPNYPFMFVLPNGNILAAGSDEAKMATYELNVATQTWSVVDPTVLDAGSAVQYLPGKIMKAGSSYLSAPPDNGGSTPSAATTYVLDTTQANPTWQQTASMANARTHLNLTVLADGTVLATGGSTDIGGVNPANAVEAAELWSPTTQTWTTMASEQQPRLYHSTAVLLPDGRVVSAGGGHNFYNNIAYPNAEIYSPPYLFKGARPTISQAPTTNQNYGQNFFVGTPDGADIASVALVGVGSDTHAFNSDQRYVPLTFTQTAGGLMVTMPANADLAPPGYYMLFLVNKNGVPAIAPFVHLPVAGADTTPPTAPANLTAAGGVGAATLGWTASTDNVGVTQYNVYRSTTSGFTPSPASLIGTAAGSATTYADHVAAGTYYYLVTAQDAAGNVSTPSNQASATVTGSSGNIQLVQKATAGNEASLPSLSVAFPSANKAGDFLIVTGTAARPRGTLTISDSAGDVFVPAIGPVSDANQDVTAYVWYVANAKGGANTVTITPSSADALELHVSEWSGISQTSPVDQTASATGNGANISVGPVTTTQNGELIFAYTFPNQNSTAGSGYTPLSLVNGDLDEYLIQNTAGSVSATFTQQSDNWFALMATFKPAGPPDNQPPTAPSGLSATGSLGTVSLSWTASTDDVGVTQYNVYRSTISGFTPSPATLIGTTNGATTAYADHVAAGTYYYLVTAQDAAGNVSAPSNQAGGTSQPDATPPTVSVTSPTAGATVSGTVAVSASASDNVAVASVQFVLDGVNYGAAITSAPYSFSWNSATVSNGTHTWAAVATDTSGNSAASATVSFTVNNTSLPGLVASYSLDEGSGSAVNDSSTNKNNGTTANTSWSTTGEFGGALQFSGATNSMATIADSPSVDLTSGLTLEAWVKASSLSSPSGGWDAVVAKDNKASSANDISYALYAAAGAGTAPALHLLVGGRDVGVQGTSVLTLNTWVFLAATYDGATMRLYVNGTQVASRSQTGSITTTKDPLHLGGDWDSEMFTGLIDNVRVYNRALSASELQSDMNTPISARPLEVADVPGAGGGATLTDAALAAAVAEAVVRWGAAGASADQLQVLRTVTVRVEDLPHPYLGIAVGDEVWISRTAAGYGWFTDPGDDAAFAAGGVRGVDLLTTVVHEFGHVLGYEDQPGGVSAMDGTLPPGVRRPALLPGDAGSGVVPSALNASIHSAEPTGLLAHAPAGEAAFVGSAAHDAGRPGTVPEALRAWLSSILAGVPVVPTAVAAPLTAAGKTATAAAPTAPADRAVRDASAAAAGRGAERRGDVEDVDRLFADPDNLIGLAVFAPDEEAG